MCGASAVASGSCRCSWSKSNEESETLSFTANVSVKPSNICLATYCACFERISDWERWSWQNWISASRSIDVQPYFIWQLPCRASKFVFMHRPYCILLRILWREREIFAMMENYLHNNKKRQLSNLLINFATNIYAYFSCKSQFRPFCIPLLFYLNSDFMQIFPNIFLLFWECARQGNAYATAQASRGGKGVLEFHCIHAQIHSKKPFRGWMAPENHHNTESRHCASRKNFKLRFFLTIFFLFHSSRVYVWFPFNQM